MLAIIAASFVVSLTAPNWMPLAAYFVWLLVAMLLLRFRPLVLVGAANAVAGVLAMALSGPLTVPRAVAMAAFVVAVLLVLVVASRQRSGLPTIAERGVPRRPAGPAAGAGPDPGAAGGVGRRRPR